MDTFSTLIDLLGGPAVVARGAGKDPGTGRQWKLRNNIPSHYWPSVIEVARTRKVPGVTHALLTKLSVTTNRQRQAAA